MLKNIIRIVLVITTAVIAHACRDEFDNFVALIGGIVGVPLGIVIPAIAHLVLVGSSRRLAILIVVVGVACAAFSTYQSIALWGAVAQPPSLCEDS